MNQLLAVHEINNIIGREIAMQRLKNVFKDIEDPVAGQEQWKKEVLYGFVQTSLCEAASNTDAFCVFTDSVRIFQRIVLSTRLCLRESDQSPRATAFNVTFSQRRARK